MAFFKRDLNKILASFIETGNQLVEFIDQQSEVVAGKQHTIKIIEKEISEANTEKERAQNTLAKIQNILGA